MRVSSQFFAPPPNRRGFIVVEGVNGAGKGTLLATLQAHFQQQGEEVVLTREPGGTPLGLTLRKILLDSPKGGVTPEAELFLFAADRTHHITTLIEPALARGAIVLSDRYHYSTTAFQGYGRGLDLKTVTAVNSLAAGRCPPDVVVLLDLDPREGLRRTAARQSLEHDAFESEAMQFHERIRAGFLAQADTLPEPFLVVDAAQTPQAIAAQVIPVVTAILKARQKPHAVTV